MILRLSLLDLLHPRHSLWRGWWNCPALRGGLRGLHGPLRRADQQKILLRESFLFKNGVQTARLLKADWVLAVAQEFDDPLLSVFEGSRTRKPYRPDGKGVYAA